MPKETIAFNQKNFRQKQYQTNQFNEQNPQSSTVFEKSLMNQVTINDSDIDFKNNDQKKQMNKTQQLDRNQFKQFFEERKLKKSIIDSFQKAKFYQKKDKFYWRITQWIIGSLLMFNFFHQAPISTIANFGNDNLISQSLQRLNQITVYNYTRTTNRKIVRPLNTVQSFLAKTSQFFTFRSLNVTIITQIKIGFKNLSSRNIYFDQKNKQYNYRDKLSILSLKVELQSNVYQTFFDYWSVDQVKLIEKQIKKQYEQTQTNLISQKINQYHLNPLMQNSIFQKHFELLPFSLIYESSFSQTILSIQQKINRFVNKIRKVFNQQ